MFCEKGYFDHSSFRGRPHSHVTEKKAFSLAASSENAASGKKALIKLCEEGEQKRGPPQMTFLSARKLTHSISQ